MEAKKLSIAEQCEAFMNMANPSKPNVRQHVYAHGYTHESGKYFIEDVECAASKKVDSRWKGDECHSGIISMILDVANTWCDVALHPKLKPMVNVRQIMPRLSISKKLESDPFFAKMAEVLEAAMPFYRLALDAKDQGDKAAKARIGKMAKSNGYEMKEIVTVSEPSQPQLVVTEEMKEKACEAVAEALGDALDCTRVWSAWGVGTMSQDDFSLVAQDSSRVLEIVEAVLGVIGNTKNP